MMRFGLTILVLGGLAQSLSGQKPTLESSLADAASALSVADGKLGGSRLIVWMGRSRSKIDAVS
jgi:hypothetical protein